MTTGDGSAGGTAEPEIEGRRAARTALDLLRCGTDVERTVFFSDAVFAIAMTLLVLELRVPESRGIDADAFADAVGERIPALIAFVVSFFLVGMTWMTHHRRFRAIVAYDPRLQLLNLVVLFFVAFMPVPSSMLFQPSGRSAIPPIVYAATMMGIFGSLNAVWWYAHRAGLLAESVSEPFYRHALGSTHAVFFVFLLSIPVALLDASAAEYLWIAIWPISMVYGRWLLRRFEREETARLADVAAGT